MGAWVIFLMVEFTYNVQSSHVGKGYVRSPEQQKNMVIYL